MSLDAVAKYLQSLSLRQAVWFFPVTFALHVFEEWPGFVTWAQRHASERFTRRDYLVTHGVGLVVSLLSAGMICLYPNQWTVFVFYAFVFAPGVLFNSFFHAGASAASGAYCPGLVTAMVCYVPLFFFLSLLACRDGVFSIVTAALALSIGGLFHVLEVGHNIYKAW